MIKVLLFDLDGVLADIKNIHYEALNEALKKVLGHGIQISYSDHIKNMMDYRLKQN